MAKLAFITPSYVGSQERADFSQRSLASLKEVFGNQYTHIVVDDVPHFKGRFIHRFPDPRYRKLADQIYQGDNIRLLRQHGQSSAAATVRATREALHTGHDLVFLHLDDMVYIPQAASLIEQAIDAFDRVEDLQMVRLTGIPILSRDCTPELGNRTELSISENRIQFENLTLQPQRFDDYTLWSSPFHESLIDGRYYAIPMWFSVYRSTFLEKLLTLNDTLSRLKTLAAVEIYYKDPDHWRKVVNDLEGKFGYINMQFGGLEIQRNKNWETLINLPNVPVR